jgi:hypothetical protein
MAGEINFGLLNTNTPAEAALAPVRGMGAVNALISQDIQNQAGQFELQNALAEREAFKQGAETGNVSQALMERGLGRQAASYQKTAAETQQSQMKALAERLPIQREMAKQMALNPSPENIVANVKYQVGMGWMTPEQAQNTLQELSTKSPQELSAYFTNSAAKAEDFGKMLQDQQGLLLRQQEADTSRQRLQFEMNPEQQGRISAAKAGGTETGKSAAKAAADLPNAIESAERGIALIDEMVGKAPVRDASGKVIEKGTAPHPGFSSYVGATLTPGARFLEGSDTASFELRQKQIEGQAFLDAFQTLKGGGQITEKEGEKATAAISRMNKAASEVEYVKAARELQEVLREGVKRAKAKAARGGAGAPLPKNKWASALAEFEAQENQ